MKIYVAARFYMKEEVQRLYKILQSASHTITADWTVHTPIKPYDKNPDKAKEYAVEDINGVCNCDIFILLTSEDTGSGVSTEFGAAIASNLIIGKPKIYVVGKYVANNLCYFHPSVHFKDSFEKVLKEL